MDTNNTIIWLEETDSTNKFTKTLIKNNAIKSGTIIASKKQTNGKGQFLNVWLSEPNKNLTFSLYLEINVKAIHQFYISKIIAISVYEFISSRATNAKIKWPNDIYVNNNKIAGILIENTIQGEYITKSIIGIGININQIKFNNKLPNPTSLKLETNNNFNIKELLSELSDAINAKLGLLNNFDKIDKQYNNLLYKLNTECKFKKTSSNDIITGEIVETAIDGRLVIKTIKGLEKYGFHEIKYILD